MLKCLGKSTDKKGIWGSELVEKDAGDCTLGINQAQFSLSVQSLRGR
jgi:hypothetical protein